MILPSSSYLPPATPQPPLANFKKQEQKPSLQTPKPISPVSQPGMPLDAESKIIRGWHQGIQDNKDHKVATALMGIGCILMNFIPGLKMRWGTTIKMAIANMGLMALIHQGLGMIKGYQNKSN